MPRRALAIRLGHLFGGPALIGAEFEAISTGSPVVALDHSAWPFRANILQTSQRNKAVQDGKAITILTENTLLSTTSYSSACSLAGSSPVVPAIPFQLLTSLDFEWFSPCLRPCYSRCYSSRRNLIVWLGLALFHHACHGNMRFLLRLGYRIGIR